MYWYHPFLPTSTTLHLTVHAAHAVHAGGLLPPVVYSAFQEMAGSSSNTGLLDGFRNNRLYERCEPVPAMDMRTRGPS